MKEINIKNLLKIEKDSKNEIKAARSALGRIMTETEKKQVFETIPAYKKLAEELRTAEGRATARTLTPARIIEIVARIDKKLNIPDTKKDGIKGHYTGAEKFPNSYKYFPESTHFYFEYRKSGVYITDIRRDICPNKVKDVDLIELPDEAKTAIIESVINSL